jgi:hypothetical protein
MSALRSLRRASGLLVAALAVSSVVATSSVAAYTVTPARGAATDPAGSYFMIEAQPGDTITDAIVIDNPDPEPVTLRVAVVGAQTGEFGGVVYDLIDAPQSETAAWFTLADTTVTIPADDRKQVRFSLAVPEEAPAGTHLAGLSISDAADDAESTTLNDGPVSAGVTIRSRRVIALQVDVPGPRTPLLEGDDAMAAVKPQGVFAKVLLNNAGTDLLRPTGTFTLTDPSGATLIEEPFTLGTVVPGTDVAIAFPWSETTPAAGTYPVRVTATDASGATLDWNDTIVIDAAVAESATDRVVTTTAPTAPAAGPDMTLIALMAGILGAVVVGLMALAFFVISGSRRREQQLRDELNRSRGPVAYGPPNGWNGYGPNPYDPTNQQPGPWNPPGPNDRPDRRF